MKKQLMAGMAAGLLLIGMSETAHASLVVSGTGTMAGVSGSYNLIYDTDLNITWLDYSKGYDTWQNEVNWASNLSVNVNGQNITGWRLPSTVDGPYVSGMNGTTTAGYNITTSEMGHLFYTELGNHGEYDTGGNPQPGDGLTSTGVFNNLVFSTVYWSGTEYAANPDFAWGFYTRHGEQSIYRKGGNIHALAVLPGQISSVPAPATLLLMGSGLAGLLGVRRKKK